MHSIIKLNTVSWLKCKVDQATKLLGITDQFNNRKSLGHVAKHYNFDVSARLCLSNICGYLRCRYMKGHCMQFTYHRIVA